MEPVASFPWPWAHVTGTTTTPVKTGRGTLHTIVVNGLTTVGDITVYDGVDATGAVIAVLHLDIATSVSVQPITFVYDCKIVTGIYIEYDQAVAADLTVTYI